MPGENAADYLPAWAGLAGWIVLALALIGFIVWKLA